MSAKARSSGLDRSAFIARVSTALGRRAVAAPTAAAPRIDQSIVRVATAGQDLAGLFALRAIESGMVVHSVDLAALHDRVAELICGFGATRAAMPGVDALTGLQSVLKARGVDVLSGPTSGVLDDLYGVDVGITDVRAAIAETGTLVCWSGPLHGRGVSLVPPVHIAVVRRSDIVPDMIDYLARHAAEGGALPSSIVFITGPSKTADIEGILITGVHGPREVHIMLVGDA